MKQCTKCKKTKSANEFYSKGSQCKTCICAGVRDYQERNASEISKKRSEKRRTPEGRRKQKERDLQRYYGLSYIEFIDRLLQQDFTCAACRDPLNLGKRTHIDHHHESGKIRKVLCVHCNLIVGHCKEDPVRLESVITYLKEHV